VVSSERTELIGWNHSEAEALGEGKIIGCVKGAAHAGLNGCGGVDHSLFGRPLERRAVEVALAEVEVRVSRFLRGEPTSKAGVLDSLPKTWIVGTPEEIID